MKQIIDTSLFAVRRIFPSNDYKAGDVITEEGKSKLLHLDEGYRIFKTLKTSPSYWHNVKNDMFAMILQIGYPTFFLTFSSADTHWPDLQKTLARMHLNESWTNEEVSTKPFLLKASLIKKDPVTTVRHYYQGRGLFQQNV